MVYGHKTPTTQIYVILFSIFLHHFFICLSLQDQKTVIYQNPDWRPSIQIRIIKDRIRATQIQMQMVVFMCPVAYAIHIVCIKTR